MKLLKQGVFEIIKMKKFALLMALFFGAGAIVWAGSQSRRPSVGLRVEPEYFSPNGDEFQDSTFFLPVLKSEKEITRWRLMVTNEKGKVVQRLHGAEFPALIQWDGSDRKGRVASEGKYFGQLIVWGSKFKISSPLMAVYIDNTPPFASLTVSPTFYSLTATGENKLIFSPQIEDSSPIQNWEFRVSDAAERTIHLEWSSGSIHNLDWDGTNEETGILAPRGVYRCNLQVVDKAGNRSLPAFIDVEINVSAQELLNRVLRCTKDLYVTDMGLIVQLHFEKIFQMKRGKPVFKPEADEYLREAAIIINAYPEVPVSLNGYARQLKTWNADRNLSSRLAWDVYSYLVKKGKVVGSRIKVNGKGRSPTFSRRQYDNPPHFMVLKNGVEIILEGKRDWSQ